VTAGPDTDDVGTVTIGAREIYDKVTELADAVTAANMLHAVVADKVADHETRLRAVERWKYSIPAALATSVIAAATTILTK
jgi:tellurite resistance protein